MLLRQRLEVQEVLREIAVAAPTSPLTPSAAPALPVQENSFAAGWHWRLRETPEGVPELRLDATHLNARGNYLIGCLWYEVLSGGATTDGTFVPAGIAMADAARLRRIAHEVASLG